MSTRDVLSSEEVEALLERADDSAVGERDEIAPGEVCEYSFGGQEHIVRGPLPTLEMVTERFSRCALKSLTHFMRREVDVQFQGIADRRFARYASELSGAASLHIVRLDPLPSVGMLVLDATLVSMIVDGYFGGGGDAIEAPRNEFSPAETRVARRVGEKLLEDLVEAWRPVVGVSGSVVRSEGSLRFVTALSPSETLVIARMRVSFAKQSGELHAVFTHSQLEPIREQLAGGSAGERAQTERFWGEALARSVRDARVELRARLLESEMPLRDVLSLKAGDVLALDVPERLPLLVDEVPLFMGGFVSHRGRNAVKIDQLLDPGALD